MKSLYISRLIDKDLLEWKSNTDRKPLLLRGARQVGKSTAVRRLAESFKNYLEVNFEEQSAVHEFFATSLNAHQICQSLSIYYGVPIIEGETLIFFDEIQSCPKALASLRFFYEQMAGQHLICAGSLLEFALSELPSFGVGRIRTLFMFPLSFDEFLVANGEEALLNLKRESSFEKPLLEPFHYKLIDYLKKFLVLGGMPEVVSKFVTQRGIDEVQASIDDLLVSFKADFTKYKRKVPSSRLLEIFQSVALQSGSKFVLKNASQTANHLQIKEAVELLVLSGLVVEVLHSSANGIPLGAEVDVKKRKLFLLDTGLLQRLSGLDITKIIAETEFNAINKGSIAEQFVGLEMLKYSARTIQNQLYYWHREKKNSNAEVDYVIQNQQNIIPVEVKSGSKGSMQSMYQFMSEKGSARGIRFSLETFSKVNGVVVIPLYAVSNIFLPTVLK